MPGIVGHGVLRPPSQIFDGSDDFTSLRVDRADALAAPIDREYSFRLAVVKNCVRVFSDRHFIDDRKGLQIEDVTEPGSLALMKPRPKSLTMAMPWILLPGILPMIA